MISHLDHGEMPLLDIMQPPFLTLMTPFKRGRHIQHKKLPRLILIWAVPDLKLILGLPSMEEGSKLIKNPNKIHLLNRKEG
jgi:hypothetical protein